MAVIHERSPTPSFIALPDMQPKVQSPPATTEFFTVVVTCLAQDRTTGDRCTVVLDKESGSTSRWCEYHHRQEGKMHSKYKLQTDEYERFDDTLLCTDVRRIFRAEAVGQLKGWHGAAKKKFILGSR